MTPPATDKRSATTSAVADRGFTLIELLVAVTIIGILSVLAVVGYRKISSAGRTGEAINMLGGIMTAQEAAKVETGSYVNASDGNLAVNGRTTNCYPPGTPTDGRKVAWLGWSSNAVNDAWVALSVNATAPVQYCYTTVAGAAGVAPSTLGGGIDFTREGTAITWPDGSNPLVTRGPWVISAATLDSDGDGTFQSIVLSSWNSGPMYDHDGE